MDAVYQGKIKKKKREREVQTFVESSNVQNESEKKRHKNKREKDVENLSDQTPTEKKKKRKLNKREFDIDTEQATLINDGLLHEVNDATSPSKEEERKKKRKKVKRTHSDCDDTAKDPHEEQSGVTTEMENMPNDQQTAQDLTDPATQTHIQTFQIRKKNGQLKIIEIDLKLRDELEEFVPDIKSTNLINVRIMILNDLPRFKEFKRQGIPLRYGRFSYEENKRLRRNVLDFLALTGVDNVNKLFHVRRFPDERKQLMKLKRENKFFLKIAEGIPRTCYKVFFRGRKCFDHNNYKGRFDDEEVKALIKYQTIHGNDWLKISKLTGRSTLSLEKRYSQISKKFGPWSEKELQRLLKAVHDYMVTELKSMSTDTRTPTRVSREILYKRLPWFEIARKVKTRCWTKCRVKWMDILAVRMSSGTLSQGRKSHLAKIRLIQAMYESQVDDPVNIDWEDLTSTFGDVPPAYVQMKWHQLKVCYVPNWKNNSFEGLNEISRLSRHSGEKHTAQCQKALSQSQVMGPPTG
ncbi:transcription termination factor 1-like isoform X2 [Triplophysa dalaica]|uniref:transcription termination factor 1-like isoform X2 n=1 Tax=Triplophysa dalaica TaxID=1582913 RepID=UPI0024DFC2CC|nr:transcription termination factor 1-like isoform X2 [Triplophysa dalaica]